MNIIPEGFVRRGNTLENSVVFQQSMPGAIRPKQELNGALTTAFCLPFMVKITASQMSQCMEKLVDEILFNSLQIPFSATMQINPDFFFCEITVSFKRRWEQDGLSV